MSGSASATCGTSIPLSTTVTNQGSGPSGACSVGLYLSLDPLISATDLRVGSRYVTGLAAGATSAATTNIFVSTTLAHGAYYLGVLVDPSNQVKERDETNNATAGNRIAIQ